jgi:rSAM/selenodomain-associated transferase 1
MPREHPDPVAVAIFAKAPVAGFAKTRLIPRLGEQGAANLQRQLIERTVRIACEARLGPAVLWCSPDSGHEVFTSLGKRYDIALQDQVGTDLGARMHHAFAVHTATCPTLLIGTDCVVMTAQLLLQSAALLRRGADIAVVPVEDGGYVLMGLRKPSPELFTGIGWGGATVVAETRARARAAGLRLEELPPLWDIDRVEDYERAIAGGYL